MKSCLSAVRKLVPLVLFLVFSINCHCQKIDDFSLESIEGKMYSLSENTDGKVLVLTFFTTYCKPCMQEHPHLEKILKKYQKDGLKIIAISADEPGNRSKVRLWKRRYRLTFPILLDSNSELTRKYNPDLSFPLTLLLDRDKSIRKTYQGFNTGDQQILEKDVRAILGLKEQ